MLLIISLNVLNKGKYDIMILMKILFVCLIVLPFLLFSLYILRYTFKVLNASKKKIRFVKIKCKLPNETIILGEFCEKGIIYFY